ncbi:SDR family oxidoreductase [Moritella viscosa]|uniref:SDR family oxidoreductase n=1 Tax=Moritella viscosa TaxID=80854 RepID=UPI00091CED0C|nr:SDR family oxidoreductase [Moritella viscosa]SGY89229.1 Putative uncharacterized protein [Moritella viscosa]
MTTTNLRILIAGSTGYLGRHLVHELLIKNADFKVLARDSAKLEAMGVAKEKIEIVQVTDAQSLDGCCDGVDVVISCVGITRQKDRVGYMDVDFQANLNLLLEAERAGVKKFIYVSALNAKKYSCVRLLKAKEAFVTKLLAVKSLEACIIRPNGFYSDIEEFYSMAKAGRVYLFGSGNVRLNPIHGEDLARFCLEAIDKPDRELDIGGPEVFSVSEIAKAAFNAQDKRVKITYLPDWIRKIALFIATMLPEALGGPAEFFLTAMAQDMIAPSYGNRKIDPYFKHIFQSDRK